MNGGKHAHPIPEFHTVSAPRLCVNCRHSYQTPRTDRIGVVSYPSLVGCRRFYDIDLVTGEPFFHSAHDMRGSGRACGPAGDLFEGHDVDTTSERDGFFSLLD